MKHAQFHFQKIHNKHEISQTSSKDKNNKSEDTEGEIYPKWGNEDRQSIHNQVTLFNLLTTVRDNLEKNQGPTNKKGPTIRYILEYESVPGEMTN